MWRLPVLFVLVIFHTFVNANQKTGVCALTYCKCSPSIHPHWTTVNCTVPDNQRLDLHENGLPESTTDLIVSGAEVVMFAVNSLSRLKDARQIRLTDVKVILIRKHTAVNLNTLSIYLHIERCSTLRIEERSFTNIKGPLSVTINDCNNVSVEGEAFSWLLTMSIANVEHLRLGPSAFVLDPTAGNVGEHGPGMSITMKNVSDTEFPNLTFGSSAAEISMESVSVRTIRPGAFTANTYNIVMAVNCSFYLIESESFSRNSLFHTLHFYGCVVHQLASKALQSAVGSLNLSHSKFKNVESDAINITVAAIDILDNVFHNFEERSFEFSSWNKLRMERNLFDDLPSYAIIAPGTSIHELVFIENEIETIHPNSLEFIGDAYSHFANNIIYKNNYYGHPCYCNISLFLGTALGTQSVDLYEMESYCTVDEFFAKCFDVPEQNLVLKKFIDEVCSDKSSVHCVTYKVVKGEEKEIKNSRFPHKKEEDEGLSERDKKIVGIVVVVCLGCVIIAMFVSFIRWMRRRGYCVNVKNFLISSNSSCGAFCDRLCTCGVNNGLDNARSISRLSVNEYTERHRLNEPRVQAIIQETAIQEDLATMEDKTTQTLPEELTKELLENLKEKLDNPEKYVEAREMIEHLYELTKIEEMCNSNTPTLINVQENIYELPFQNTTPRIGKNKKQMISIGTKTPSLDKLLPLSPYNRQTALAHEYFEPKDLAVHLYAEIANSEKEKRSLLGAIPDLVAEQAIPRGPYLRAVRDKNKSSDSTSPSTKSLSSVVGSPRHLSTIKSNTSNSSGKMINRPLPEKPTDLDPGEGTSSFKHG